MVQRVASILGDVISTCYLENDAISEQLNWLMRVTNKRRSKYNGLHSDTTAIDTDGSLP